MFPCKAINKLSATTTAFRNVLIKHGALNAVTGTLLVKGVGGEDALLKEWNSYARGFIHKGRRIDVEMRVERLLYNESICKPVIYLK